MLSCDSTVAESEMQHDLSQNGSTYKVRPPDCLITFTILTMPTWVCCKVVCQTQLIRNPCIASGSDTALHPSDSAGHTCQWQGTHIRAEREYQGRAHILGRGTHVRSPHTCNLTNPMSHHTSGVHNYRQPLLHTARVP